MKIYRDDLYIDSVPRRAHGRRLVGINITTGAAGLGVEPVYQRRVGVERMRRGFAAWINRKGRYHIVHIQWGWPPIYTIKQEEQVDE